jgi:PBP1b-binding outer membrane lipoprotein LpoB
MRSITAIAALALAFGTCVPLASFADTPPAATAGMAKPTSDQVKAALKATNPSMRQLRKLKPMIETYKSESAGADDATKSAATKELFGGMKTVLSPEQMQTFKQSLMSSMM